MRSDFVTIKGKKIHFVREGKGSPIVLVHGWSQSWMTWRKVIPLLKDDFEVVVIDLPGCGESDRLDEYTLETEVESVRGVCEELGLENPIVVGVSMGCFVALRMGAMDEIRGVVLVGVVFRQGKNVLTHGMMRETLRMSGTNQWTTKVCKQVVNNELFARYTARWLQLDEYNKSIVDDLRHGRETAAPKAVVDMGIISTSVDTMYLLKSCKVSVYVVQGVKDKFESIDKVEGIMESMGDGYDLKRVEGCGHTVQLEKPELLVEAIRGRFV